jgi:hypothetical protein
MNKQWRLWKMSVNKLSRSVAEQAVIANLDEMDYLLKQSKAEVEGIREAFVNYLAVCEQIIKDLAPEVEDAK